MSLPVTPPTETPFRQYICNACGWIYDEAKGRPLYLVAERLNMPEEEL